jgi:hypothetical protein
MLSSESARRVRYQKANRAVGLCASCSRWSGAAFYCTRHRNLKRERERARYAALLASPTEAPGTTPTTSGHGDDAAASPDGSGSGKRL